MSDFPTTYTQWLAKLVSTTSNVEMMEYIKAYLKTFGVEASYLQSPSTTHTNLFATLPASNGVTQGGIVMSGHTDVVPVEGQKWDSDPFTLTERDGKLYGRGASDMKGFIAVCLTLTPTFMAMTRTKPVHFAFSFDEQAGSADAPLMASWLKAKGLRADCCLAGDGGLKGGAGGNGFSSWKVVLHGKAVHPSMSVVDTSCNAVQYAAQLITKARQIALDATENGKHDPTNSAPFSCMNFGMLGGGNAAGGGHTGCEFTFSVRAMHSGVAKRVEAEVQQYINETILPAMREEYPEASVEFMPDWFAPAFNANERHPFTKMVREMMREHKIRKVGGGTESGFFEEDLGIPTVLVRPGGENTHLANEYTEAALLERSGKFTEELVRRVAGKTPVDFSKV
ncbi:glutamamyl carboxypeptidase [Novymonas esmeraldas]|uniref:Glutamamyl carboxypeptidase n=1 Tax=Novymonas esmeraldas TaxID=1808958 RepID=A0AAW0F691_9TRYP